MFCGKCGKQIEDHAKFCPYCGAETGVEIENKKVRRKAAPTPGKITEAPEKREKSKSKVGIVIAGLVGVCAIAGGAWFMGKESGFSKNAAAAPETSVEELIMEESSEASSEEETTETAGETVTESITETESLEETEEVHACGTLKDDYILPDCATRYYTKDEIASLTLEEIYVARNEIYARHGREFKTEELAEYFSEKSWYNPVYTPEEFDAMGDSVFNEYEIANRTLLLEYEVGGSAGRAMENEYNTDVSDKK